MIGPDAPLISLTLSDVIEAVLQANRALLSSAYDVQSRQYSLDAAQAAFEWKMFPGVAARSTDKLNNISAGLTIEKKFTPGPVFSIHPNVVQEFNGSDKNVASGEIGVSLAIPLLRGLGSEFNLGGVRQAEYSLRSARRSHHQAKVNTVVEAVDAVYHIVQQRKLLELYETQKNKFRAHAVMAEDRKKLAWPRRLMNIARKSA
jgi:outer membrane protein